MAGADYTDVFKAYYAKMGPDAVYQRNPFLTMMEDAKMASPSGQITVNYANTQKVGTDYAQVFSGSAGDANWEAFNYTQKSLYGFSDFSGQVLRNFKNGKDDNFFKNYAVGKLNILLNSITSNAAQAAFRNGAGVLGAIQTGTASPITLVNRAQATFVYPGQTLKFGPNANGTGLRVGLALVTGVDQSTGVITYTGTITSLAVGDYLFSNNSVFTGNPPGLEGWNPVTPSSNFLGADQTKNRLKLGGYAYDCVARSKGINSGLAEAIFEHYGQNGAMVDWIFMHPVDMSRLADSMAGQIRYDGVKALNTPGARSEVTFNAAYVHGVPVITDPNAEQGVARGVTKGSFFWGKNVDIPSREMLDGLDWWRTQDGTDTYRGCSAQEHCFWANEPGGLLRVALPTS